MSNTKLLQLLLLIQFMTVKGNQKLRNDCPEYCSCESKLKQVPTDSAVLEKFNRFIKVKCSGIGGNTENYQKVNFGDMASDVIQLDLSKNQLTKLDVTIFTNLTNLKRLDLSTNLLHTLDKKVFLNLKSLERLFIGQNLIKTIPFGTFKNLLSLKQLDISGNPLKCDCDLMWIVEWMQNTSVKMSPGPKCQSPSDFKGISLKKLRVGVDMHCETPITQQNHVQLNPGYNQVVFEGDPMRLHCLIGSKYSTDESGEQNAILTWGWAPEKSQERLLDLKYKDPTTLFPEINIVNRYLSDSGIIDSRLGIENVHRNQSGHFTCQMISERMNVSKSLNLIVISKETKYCHANSTTDNKGVYTWPATVVDNKVILRCQGLGNGPVFATHFCDSKGRWQNLNTTECPYINEITKILEQFAKVNLSLTKSSVIESSRVLRNLTSTDPENIVGFNDPVDVIYISQTVHNYINHLPQEKELGAILMDVGSQVMKFPRHVLRMAQNSNRSCTEIVNNLEIAAKYTPPLQAHKSNLAIEEFRVNREGFTGMTCSWHSVESTRVFRCSTSNRTMLHNPQHQLMDALIQVPASILKDSEIQTKMTPTTQQLLVGMFENNHFFPVYTTNASDVFDVTSCVVGVKLDNQAIRNLSEPVQIMLRVPEHPDIEKPPVPVWWDPDLSSGNGGWTTQGCGLSHSTNGLFVFNCHRIGYYALMQHALQKEFQSSMGARFRLLHPAIYIGSFVQFVCLLISIVTYISCFQFIQMPRKAKHTLINTWIAMLFVCLMFTLGIFQTENQVLCQSVGLVQHYLFLSSLLWMAVTVSNMYKRLSVRDSILPDDILASDPPIPKPIIGLYLLGWGVSLIVCGISGAVNIRQYASFNYCFLSSAPALTAVFVPLVILILFMLIMFLIIRHSIKRDDILGHMSEGTQATENVDLELLEPNIQNVLDRQSAQSISTPTSYEMDDQENSLTIQLKAHIIVLFLHCCMWISTALSITKPFNSYIMYEEDVFSILYAFIASMLGVFILFFYSIARSDVRSQWENMQCCIQGQRQWCRPRLISDATSNNKPQQVNLLSNMPLQPISNQDAAALALSQSLHNSSSKNIKCNSNSLVGSREISTNPMEAKVSNLVVIHRKQYRSSNSPISFPENTSGAELFYNPNQSNVARKFFKKQRRNVKHNNLEIQHMADGAASDGGSVVFKPRSALEAGIMNNDIFGTSSKVNNINIHVEPEICGKELHYLQQNPNMLSDSCTDSDFIGRSSPQAVQFIVGVDGLHVSMRNKKKNVANIYTNVPETSLPEHQRISLIAIESSRITDNSVSSDDIKSTTESSKCQNTQNSAKSKLHNSSHDSSKSLIHRTSTTNNQLQQTNSDNECAMVNSVNSSHTGLMEENRLETALYSRDNVRNISRSLETFNANGSANNVPKSSTFSNNYSGYTSNDEQAICKSESPVLFSPSLCDIYDLPTPNSSKSPYPRASSPLLEDFVRYEPDFRQSSNQSPNFDMDSNYAQYPTSEISIKSHGLYAPQPEISGNDLNLTLMNETDFAMIPNLTNGRGRPYADFRYEPSEVSAMSSLTNDNPRYSRESKTYQNCSPFRQSSISLNSVSDSLINTHNQDYAQIHSTSIDDLYEQIKRRPKDARELCPEYYENGDRFKYTNSRSADRNINNFSASAQERYRTPTTEYNS